MDRTDGWIEGRMDGWMEGRMDRRTDGRTDGWMDGRTDGWMDGGAHELARLFLAQERKAAYRNYKSLCPRCTVARISIRPTEYCTREGVEW